jgi:formate dehydrogenase alpha subunit
VDLIKLTIDGKEVEVSSGTTVLNAAEQAGIHIPRFCYDKELSSCGACRICVVEIEECAIWLHPASPRRLREWW